jgi:hypothetical protein
MINLLKYLSVLPLLLLLNSCEKEITVDLPQAEDKLVVEGFIENNMPPIIFLTKNMGYFEPTDALTLQNIIIRNAKVTMQMGFKEIELLSVCVSQLPDSLLPAVSLVSGVTVDQLKLFNYCFYTTLDTAFFGKINETYNLKITHAGKTHSASTLIPEPVPVDSLWFQIRNEQTGRGVVWMRVLDPPGKYNAYRIFSLRLGKDSTFDPAYGSVFDDMFFDGKPVEFYFYQSPRNGDDFRSKMASRGDTVVVKFCSIDASTFRFLKDYETDIASNGNPFAAPTTIKSNITGGALGYWGGYGVTYDTLIIKGF